MSKIVLHWLETSRSHRILWLFEELNVPYELKPWKRGKDGLADPHLKDIHPLGKSPVIEIHDPSLEKPVVLAESGAIVEYIIDHFGPSWTPARWREGKENQLAGETEAWLRNRQLMHYAEGSLMGFMVLSLLFQRIEAAPVPFFIRPIVGMIVGKVSNSYLNPNIKNHFNYLEGLLKTIPGEGEWFCGQLTGADILLSFPLIAAQGRVKSIKQEDYPLINAWVERVQNRDAYKRAIAKVESMGQPFKSSM